MSTKDKFASCIGRLVIFLAVIPINIIAGAYLTLMYWDWFALRLGASPITFVQSISLTMIIGFLAIKFKNVDFDEKEKDDDDDLPNWVYHLVLSGIMLSMGWATDLVMTWFGV